MRWLATASALIVAMALVPAAQAAEAEQPKPEKKICRTERGSAMLTQRKRVCLTREEWDHLEAEARKNYRDLQPSGSTLTGAMDAPTNINPPM